MIPNNPNKIKVFRQFDSDNFTGYKVWGRVLAWALSSHLGLRPKTPRESLEHIQNRRVTKKSAAKEGRMQEKAVPPFGFIITYCK